MTTHLPEEVVETIIHCLTSNRDRNSASLVNKLWYTADRYSRRSVYVSNCYALSPDRVIARFPKLTSLTLVGKPRVSDSNLLPNDWGGSAYPWVLAISQNCPLLEELRFKRMLVSDPTLDLISNSLPNFKSLIFKCCHGFTTAGLSAIASNCSLLEHLELERCEISDNSGQWLSSFPETLTSLISLNISSLDGAVNLTDLERLVSRCPKLTSLKLNRAVPANTIRRILFLAPQLMHLGVVPDGQHMQIQSYVQLSLAFHRCESVQSLSLSSVVPILFLRAIYPICSNLVFLNMRYAGIIKNPELINLLRLCPKLQRLWIPDCIGDEGLGVVSGSCKDLEDLRVFPRITQGGPVNGPTDEGLTAISTGCQRLKSLTYFCTQMTNSALITFSKRCQDITCFRICISTPKQPDRTTLQPLDDGFGAVVQSCKKLRKLTLSGLLTDQVFLYIGMYAEQLQVLSVKDGGESDAGLHYVFNGCKNIRKMEIRDCPFGDAALRANIFKYESMRSLWMSSCKLTIGGCKMIAQKILSLNVEIINQRDKMEDHPDDTMKVDKLYVYQTLAGPRHDAPGHVWTV